MANLKYCQIEDKSAVVSVRNMPQTVDILSDTSHTRHGLIRANQNGSKRLLVEDISILWQGWHLTLDVCNKT